jgi:hypothetical protein
MRRIVQKINVQEVSLSDITNDSFIGIEWDSGNKSRVITVSTDQFAGLSILDTDLRGKWTRESKKQYVKSSIEQMGRVRAYLFDSEEDLLKWILKK